MFIDTEVRPQGEQVDAVAPAKMKLSAAIRIGARLRPQAVNYLFVEGKSCALGAAYEALFGYPGDYRVSMTTEVNGVPAMNSLRERFPGMYALSMDIWRRNDSGESREQIADWLEAQGL